MPKKSYPILFWLSAVLCAFAVVGGQVWERSHDVVLQKHGRFLFHAFGTFFLVFLALGVLNWFGNRIAYRIPTRWWPRAMSETLPRLYSITVSISIIMYWIALVLQQSDPWYIGGILFFGSFGGALVFLRGALPISLAEKR